MAKKMAFRAWTKIQLILTYFFIIIDNKFHKYYNFKIKIKVIINFNYKLKTMMRRVNIGTFQSELVMVRVQCKSILKNISKFLTETFMELGLEVFNTLKLKDRVFTLS